MGGTFDDLLRSPLPEKPPRPRPRWIVPAAIATVVLAIALFFVIRPDTEPDELLAVTTQPAAETGGVAITTISTTMLPAERGYPSERFFATMVLDPDSGVVMYGGGTTTGAYAFGTWLWEPEMQEWLSVDLAAPPTGRTGQAATYVDSLGGILWFGGGTPFQVATACQVGVCPAGFLGDTWFLDIDGGGWQQLQPPNSPGPRVGAAMAYDASADLVVMFGGVGEPPEDDPFTGTLYGETWVFDPGDQNWELAATAGGPSPRAGHQMVYDPGTERVYLWGGRNNETLAPPSDMWAFDVEARAWSEIEVVGDSLPNPRWLHRFMYEPVSERLILLGGEWFEDTQVAGDMRMWTFDPETATWERVGPESVSGPHMAAPDGRGGIISFGDTTIRWDGTEDEWRVAAQSDD